MTTSTPPAQEEVRASRKARDAARYQDHKEERSARAAAYYQSHKGEILAYKADYNAAHREEKRERDSRQQRWFIGNLRILRAAQGCDDCGVHEGRLEHHHVDPATKRCQISEMYSYSLDAFMDEVAKCVVSCPSCHQKHHVELRRAEGVLA